MGQRATEETAVMLHTTSPLLVTGTAMEIEDVKYMEGSPYGPRPMEDSLSQHVSMQAILPVLDRIGR